MQTNEKGSWLGRVVIGGGIAVVASVISLEVVGTSAWPRWFRNAIGLSATATPVSAKRPAPSEPPLLAKTEPRASASAAADTEPAVDPLLVPQSSPEFPNPLGAPLCKDVIAALIIESRDPGWAFASLQSSDESEPHQRRVGERVGNRVVRFIGVNPRASSPAVWLTKGRELCQVLYEAGKNPEAEAKAEPPPDPLPPPAPPEVASKIKRMGETQFKIDRAVVNEVLKSTADLLRSDRIVPITMGGEVIGMRMFGIPEDSVVAKLGLKHGDRLEAIDGEEVKDPEKALDAYVRMRTASTMNVRVTRQGEPVIIDYEIE